MHVWLFPVDPCQFLWIVYHVYLSRNTKLFNDKDSYLALDLQYCFLPKKIIDVNTRIGKMPGKAHACKVWGAENSTTGSNIWNINYHIAYDDI